MLNEATFEELLAWSDELGLLPRVPSGPGRGRNWDAITLSTPPQDLAGDRDFDVRFSAETELRRRHVSFVEPPREPDQRSLL